MTKAEYLQLKKGSWLEGVSGIFEISGITPDRLISVKEVIFVDDFDNCNNFIYGTTSYITHREVRQMELIAE